MPPESAPHIEPEESKVMTAGAPNAASEPVKEVFIDGRWYDITNFVKIHPGGSVIAYMMGKDASEAFHAFHARSQKAPKWLQSLPSREPNSSDLALCQDPLIRDFIELREQLDKEGFFKASYLHVAYRLLEALLLFIWGAQLLSAGWFWTGIFIAGMAESRCAWFMHEAGHYSITGRISLDRFLQFIVFSMGCGMSSGYWRRQHNRHHAAPQKLNHDVDLDTLPFVAFNKFVASHGNHKILQFQAFLFPPFSAAVVLLWSFFLHPRHVLRTGKYYKLVPMLFNHAMRLYIAKDYGLSGMLICYFVVQSVESLTMFFNFALSHTHKPVVAADVHLDWIRHTSGYTTNIEPSWWCDWWMGYLNYQIEHHLFPHMPQFRQRQIVPRVRALFQKHGLQYDCRSYWDAVKATFSNLHNVGMES